MRKPAIFLVKGVVFILILILLSLNSAFAWSSDENLPAFFHYASRDKSFNLGLDIDISCLYNLKTDESEWDPNVDFLLYGALSKNISFYERLAAFGWPSLEEAYLEYAPADYKVWLGKKKMCWGPAYYGNLLISEDAGGFNSLELGVDMGDFTARYFSSILQRSGGKGSTQPQRNLSAHRLEWRPSPEFTLAFSETVLYTHRGLEPIYAVPNVISYFWAERYIAEELGRDLNDNVFMSFDINWRPDEKKDFYGEFLIDDLQDEIFYGKPADEPQLVGATLGTRWEDPAGVKGITLRSEYTAITRWVYTSIKEEYPEYRYTHNGEIIGHWLGPDADLLTVEAIKSFGKKLEASLKYQRERHGEGRDLSDVWHEEEYGVKTRLLSGTVETSQRVRLKLEYIISESSSTSFAFEKESIKNKDNQPSKGEDANRIEVGIKTKF